MKFEDILGHDSVKKHLLREVNLDRTPHAQILSSIEGCGTLALALAFAQYLMCEDKRESDSCGTCTSCIKNAKYIHPDLHFSFPSLTLKNSSTPATSNDYMDKWRQALIENPFLNYNQWMQSIQTENKQGNITVKECHSIIGKLALKTYENENKVLIMWLPEYLGNSGNALLKIIEEPTPKTYIIFVTNRIERILPTILSRMQILNVLPLSDLQIKEYLLTKYGLDEDRAQRVAFVAEGNLSLAIALSKESDDTSASDFAQWMRLVGKKENSELMQYTDALAVRGKEQIKNFLWTSLKFLRECNALKYRENYEHRLLEINNNFINNFSKFLDHESVERMYLEINKSIANIERNVNVKIELFQLSLTLKLVLNTQNRKNKAAVAE